MGNLRACSVFGEVLGRRCLSMPVGKMSDKAAGSGAR